MTNQRYHPDLGSETSLLNLCVETSGDVAKCWLFFQATQKMGQQRDRKTSGGGGYSGFQVTGIIEWPGQKSK